MKKILIFGLIALLSISIVSASEDRVHIDREATIAYAQTKILSCLPMWGEECPEYKVDIDMVLDRLVNFKAKGIISLKSGNDEINVEVKRSQMWGSDAYVSYDVIVREKIGSKTVVYNNMILPEDNYSGHKFANFRTGWDGEFCVNFGVSDGDDFQTFCVQ